jgi:hypothetical protein
MFSQDGQQHLEGGSCWDISVSATEDEGGGDTSAVLSGWGMLSVGLQEKVCICFFNIIAQ